MESNQPTTKTPSKSNKKIAAIAITILIIALTAGVTYGLISSNPTGNTNSTQENQENNNQATNPSATPKTPTSTSWITKGSYATYQGQADIMSMSITFKARMEITNTNDTHIQISTSYDMSSPFGKVENTTSIWVSRAEMNFQPEGLDLTTSYPTQVTLANLGTRSCTVYKYENADFKATYYVDNLLNWPVKITMTSPAVEGQSYNMDVSLTESNIPGL